MTSTTATDRTTIAALLVLGTAVAITFVAMLNGIAVSPMTSHVTNTTAEQPEQDGGQ